jgi:hypothetical protein
LSAVNSISSNIQWTTCSSDTIDLWGTVRDGAVFTVGVMTSVAAYSHFKPSKMTTTAASNNAQAVLLAALKSNVNRQPRGSDPTLKREGSKTPSFPDAPPEPQSLAEAGLNEGDVEALVLKTLLQLGNSTGSEVAQEICLSRSLTSETLSRLRDELLIAIKTSSGVNDFVYQLTEAGAARAKQHATRCNYVGAAPVPLAVYADATRRQSIQNTRLKIQQLQAALADLTLRTEFVQQIAQAIHDGRGLFLYGDPGNGKTTIAERIVGAFGQHLWIPRMVTIGGDLLRLFDATCHQPADAAHLAITKYDRRWVLIERPTVVVGGELTLEQLDARYHATAGISEAPVQMKANGGALLIDDFGRQRVSSTEILNRLIVPLEKQIDYLNLASGRQIQVPFDLLFILSTNLEPRQLVDEAFLRRIPYKIRVADPNEQEFRGLLEHLAKDKGFAVDIAAVDHLLDTHYRKLNRPLRFCQPRDLLRQMKNFCEVLERPHQVSRESIDAAVMNYFSTL